MRELSSGMFKSRDAIRAVAAVTRDGAQVSITREEDAGSYQAVRNLQGRSICAGMHVLASYNKYNQGADLYEVLGFTDHKQVYGEGGVVFNSVREVFKHYGVKSLVDLEKLQNKNEYGHGTYMVIKDMDTGAAGAWFYLFEGRWSRGSGAEPLSFTKMERV